MVYLDTKLKAEKAKKLFVKGLRAKQIIEKLKISEPTLYRYFQLVGGLSNADRAEHYNKRSKFRKRR